MPDGTGGAFAMDEMNKKIVVQDVTKEFYCYPFYFGGTFLSNKVFVENKFDETLGMETEKDFFLRLMAKEKKFIFLIRKFMRVLRYKRATALFMKEFTKGNGMRSHLQSSGYLF